MGGIDATTVHRIDQPAKVRTYAPQLWAAGLCIDGIVFLMVAKLKGENDSHVAMRSKEF